MPLRVRSFAKINLGLRIGPVRADGFHQLLTLYQTIDWHDVVHLDILDRGGIEILCPDPRVPTDRTNTCWRVAEQVLAAAGSTKGVRIEIEKLLPVQGGLGAASSNAVATMLGMEKLLGVDIGADRRQQIAASVGSDLPLFLLGGTVLGEGRGEVVRPLPDLPPFAAVVVTPEVSVSTPKAFADWDQLVASGADLPIFPASGAALFEGWTLPNPQLTETDAPVRMMVFRHAVTQWLEQQGIASGVPTHDGGDRVEGSASWAQSLLGLVRTGIENDFERVVFPQYSELSELKRMLYEEGAQFASLSGSGSALYGLFDWASLAETAAQAVARRGVKARVAGFIGREEFERDWLIGES
ncbi:MAG: 4-(cytidine 5'-diphospho)-2-C-methyl-D-erythritol kinase [Candidatus Korobacteraceae bacterium]